MDTISSTLLLGQTATCSFEQHAKSLIQASEANIARIDSQIRDLMRLRDRERGLITALKLVIAPIRKLPAEILVEIFLHYLDIWWYSRNDLKRVLTLSHVCAHWRQIACTTPQLWTGALPINFKKAFSDTYLSMAKTFLERSAPFPIPMTLDVESRGVAPLINSLFSSAPRWRSLQLHDYFSARFRQMAPNTLANLESIDVKIYGPAGYAAPVTAFLTAPLLRRVNLQAAQSTSHLPMPWAQLTHVTLSETSPQLSLDILLQCTSICSATFTDMNAWSVEPDAALPVALPQLESLEVRFRWESLEVGHITPFFARLELPGLSNLSLSTGSEYFWSSTDFTQFQLRSPNIEQLTIDNCSFEPDDLIAVLLGAPNLVNLSLELCRNCIDDSVLDLLRYTEQTAPVVPRLASMYAFIIDDQFTEGFMQKMVQSRWWSDAQLSALPAPPAVARWKRLCIGRSDCEDDFPAFSARFKAKMDLFRSQGLDVDIT
ncbi:hypothetical protein C8R43DRAFT_1232390 [Mycena crocata]|nr:hypothetical protein C8R43DRAFT_1232390 [Mycena crocata]